ncbi:DUF6250 domain-containing protein [Echinicola vietnamensis]|uniref:Farnesoic acid 0-methyl transferase n=1 Tax=Echinicola vietnamensis (strain DSM 17526 / LMG 23754 / KMM 6221) TaxID=926556 RepID=L0FVJ9_ECHVK|nr:DUF6250 domain-containing protein [Echinicola vietnamensis]AGA77924.1 Farnesoic acid 0-methyl transferase [Echinicola vietnamensis DSM 17526]
MERLFLIFITGAFLASCGSSESNKTTASEVAASNKVLAAEDFSTPLDSARWKVEMDDLPNSSVSVKDGKLVLDTKGGVTVWLNQKLKGNIEITYKRQVVVADGPNDRLSDLNQFWMATDPRQENLFTRTGKFEEYDSLSMYYVGFGGNYNGTTRFREYQGNGVKTLLFDLDDEAHLLKPNHWYTINIKVEDGVVSYWVDGEKFFEYTDETPLEEGYFGFRSTWSRHEIDELRVISLEI